MNIPPTDFVSWKFVIVDKEIVYDYYHNIEKLCDIVFDFETEFLELGLNQTTKELFNLLNSRVINAYILDGNIGVGKNELVEPLMRIHADVEFAVAEDPIRMWRNFAVEFSYENDSAPKTIIDIFTLYFYTRKNLFTCESANLSAVLKQIVPSFHKILLGTRLLEIVKVCQLNPGKKHFIFERFLNTDVIFSVLDADFWDNTGEEKNSISKFFSLQNNFANLLRTGFKTFTHIFLHCDADDDYAVNQEFYFSNLETFQITGKENECISTYFENVKKTFKEFDISFEYLKELNRRFTVFISNFKFDFSNKMILVNPMVGAEENALIISRHL